jgi:hypothetical protein
MLIVVYNINIVIFELVIALVSFMVVEVVVAE